MWPAPAGATRVFAEVKKMIVERPEPEKERLQSREERRSLSGARSEQRMHS